MKRMYFASFNYVVFFLGSGYFILLVVLDSLFDLSNQKDVPISVLRRKRYSFPVMYHCWS